MMFEKLVNGRGSAGSRVGTVHWWFMAAWMACRAGRVSRAGGQAAGAAQGEAECST